MTEHEADLARLAERRGVYEERAQAALTEMRPLREQQRLGQEAREQLYGGPTLAEDTAARAQETLGPLGEQLKGTRQALAQTERHRELVAERIAQMPEQMRNELSAADQTQKILMGEGDKAVDDLATIEQGVKVAQARVLSAKSVPIDAKANTTAAYEKLVTDVTDATRAGADDTTIRLLQSAADIIPRMQDLDNRAQWLDNLAKKGDQMVPIIREVFHDNWQAYTSKVQGRELAIDSTVKKAFDDIDRILLKEPGQLGRALDAYTAFFKTYATMSPGFHFRNALGAALMNSSDGVSVRNQVWGTRIWSAYRQNSNGDWWAALPSRYRDVAQDVVKAVYNSGAGGYFTAAEVGAAASGRAGSKAGRKIMQNKVVNLSRRAGEAIEGGVRAGMALDTLLGSGAVGKGARRGGSVGEATARINRIHFNYSQVSEFDQAMRRVVPFWTFMSRNVPLQVQQGWMNPRTYAHMQSFVRNFNDDREGELLPLPKYIRDMGGFRIGGQTAIAPEWGPSQADETLRQLGSAQMLSNLTPWLKTPAQLMTNTNFFYGSPYKKNDLQEVKGEMSPFASILGMLGQTEPIPGQQGVATETKYLDAIRDLIPTLAQYNRLQGTSPNREGLTTQAMWNWLGIPYKDINPDVQARERRRREGSRYYDELDEEERRDALIELARS